MQSEEKSIIPGEQQVGFAFDLLFIFAELSGTTRTGAVHAREIKKEARVVVAPQEVAVLVACGRWKKFDSRLNLPLTQPGQHTTQPTTMARPN